MNRPRCATPHLDDASIRCELVIGHGGSHYHFSVEYVLTKWRDGAQAAQTLPTQRPEPGSHLFPSVVAENPEGARSAESTECAVEVDLVDFADTVDGALVAHDDEVAAVGVLPVGDGFDAQVAQELDDAEHDLEQLAAAQHVRVDPQIDADGGTGQPVELDHGVPAQTRTKAWADDDDVPPVSASTILGAWGRTAS